MTHDDYYLTIKIIHKVIKLYYFIFFYLFNFFCFKCFTSFKFYIIFYFIFDFLFTLKIYIFSTLYFSIKSLFYPFYYFYLPFLPQFLSRTIFRLIRITYIYKSLLPRLPCCGQFILSALYSANSPATRQQDTQLLNRHQNAVRNPYGNVTSRVNTGIGTTALAAAAAVALRRRVATPTATPTAAARGGGDIRVQGNRRYGHSLLEETRTDYRILLA